LSILRKTSLSLLLPLLLVACSPEQSKSIGAQPKKTMDKVTTDINNAMQQQGQGSDRLKEEQK
jgi:hypothetical protein